MINRLIAVLFILALIVSCAGQQTMKTPEPQKVEVSITVDSATDNAIEVVEGSALDIVLTEDQRRGQGLGNLSQLSWMNDDKTKCFIKIFSGLSVADVTRFWNDIMFLRENTDITDVILFINSPGGDAFSGLALSDLILQARKAGMNIEAHASGIIASAAVPVFASCTTRYAVPGTIFMVHEAALWKWPGRESASDIAAQNELMQVLRKQYLSYLVKPASNLTYDEWREKEKKTTWFGAEKAEDWGLVDFIE